MGIRFKLLVPAFMLVVLMYSVIYFYWLPTNLENERQLYVKGEEISIELLGTAIMPSILTSDLAQVYATLRKVLSERPYWQKLELLNRDNVRLYPINDISDVEEEGVRKIIHTIFNEGKRVGVLKVYVNVDMLIEREVDRINNLSYLLLVMILMISVAAVYLQDRWINAPLKMLLEFSNNISRGQYKATLLHKSKDEFGELVASFERMRGEIESRETELQQAYEDLSKVNKVLEKQSNTDGLTGVYNRRYFDEALSKEISRSARQGSSIALVLCDIDFFKLYNDNYGHQRGDEALYKVAQAIAASFTRREDVVARYGGEEFAVILPNTELEQAKEMAEALRQNVLDLKLPHEYSECNEYVTISVGITASIQKKHSTMGELIEKADKALYKAKDSGRNAICVE